MHTASPKMSSLPVLALLLLLLAHRTPPAQGQPLPTTYITLIKEMRGLLSQPPVLSKVSSWDKVGTMKGRSGRGSGQKDSRVLSLFLTPQGDLELDDKFILRVRAQPHTWPHLPALGPHPPPAWVTSDMPTLCLTYK